MRCSIVRSIRGGESKGGKSIDNGLDERGGEWLIHSFDWDSGEVRHADEDGGVRGIHIGAFGEREDELNNDGMARAVGMATNRDNGQRRVTVDLLVSYYQQLFDREFVVALTTRMEQTDSLRPLTRPVSLIEAMTSMRCQR